ncbi:unnamed protein product [Thelazia callipaeda]|uniref:Pyrroline-5-carboxylate reductase n=1 Tax=Thelazia callipaeda TaxID=103827 RepID=A0A0N5CM72_THECL|nr:unnamed protein product [Thelazia callipaeda]
MDDVAISVKTKSSVERWKRMGYTNVCTTNTDLIKTHGRGIVFLVVKPHVRMAVFKELDSNSFVDTPLIVSVMNGVDVNTLESEVSLKGYPSNCGLVRLMTNLSTSVCAGASVFCTSSFLQQKKIDVIMCLMQYTGICLKIDENAFNAATAIAGCAPAFIFLAIEALADGGVLGGIDRSTSIKLATQAVMGAAKMVANLKKHPAVLKDEVCSAGGSTIYGVKELEKKGFRSALIEAVHTSTQRSSGLI